MPTETPVQELVGSFSFSRKVQVRQYETAEAFVNIQFPIPIDGDPEQIGAEIIANARTAAFQAKSLVFEELGLEFEVGPDGAIRELLDQKFGKVTEVIETTATEAAVTTSSDEATVGPRPPHGWEPRSKDEKADNAAWAKARFATHPNEFWDNRPKKQSGEYKSTAPDLKHKDTKTAFWLD